MEKDLATRVGKLKARLQGRWTSGLRECGVSDATLSGRNGPCPKCGGIDRFQYTDKFGCGNYHCRGCGPGDGFQLLCNVQGMTFIEALRALERSAGVVLTTPALPTQATSERMKQLMQAILAESKQVQVGDPVHTYLRNRGLGDAALTAAALKFHPKLGYYERSTEGKSQLVGEYPAMIAVVTGVNGEAVTIHRTYLSNGGKAPVAEPKKLLSSGIRGSAIHLHHAEDEVAIAEGIETALAVGLATCKPSWSAISARNMELLVLPPSIRRVRIYADNDSHSKFDGQASAYVLARRLRQEDASREVEVFVPRHQGADWADVWLKNSNKLKAA